jgi:hypothetical protein
VGQQKTNNQGTYKNVASKKIREWQKRGLVNGYRIFECFQAHCAEQTWETRIRKGKGKEFFAHSVEFSTDKPNLADWRVGISLFFFSRIEITIHGGVGGGGSGGH